MAPGLVLRLAAALPAAAVRVAAVVPRQQVGADAAAAGERRVAVGAALHVALVGVDDDVPLPVVLAAAPGHRAALVAPVPGGSGCAGGGWWCVGVIPAVEGVA